MSTTHRLRAEPAGDPPPGYLAFDAERKRYRIGSRLVRLVHISQDTATIKMQADPLLTALANPVPSDRLPDAARRQSWSWSYLCPARRAAGLGDLPGGRFPIHATATGKATFAFQPEAVVDRLLRRPLEKLQPATLADPEAVRASWGQCASSATR